jgi:hypothetical protein
VTGVTTLQVATALTAAIAALLVVGVRRRTVRFTLAGATQGGTRAIAVPVLATLAVLAVAGVVAVLSSHHARGSWALAPRGRTVIVLDVSGSVSAGGYGRRLATALRVAAARAGGTAGLVVFADDAVEVLPASAPASAAARLARFFAPPSNRPLDSIVTGLPLTYASPTPWSDAFIGNTNISSGLELARKLLGNRPRSSSNPKIILISDLQDGDVGSRLRTVVGRIVRDGIDARAMPVGATPDDVAKWQRYGGSVDRSTGRVHVGTSDGADVGGDIPAASARVLAICAVAVAALLAAVYAWLAPMRLVRSRRPA